MTVATWWSSQQTQLATQGSRYFRAESGSFGGECRQDECSTRGAVWFNRGNCHYYCASCAAEINAAHASQGESAVCNRHF